MTGLFNTFPREMGFPERTGKYRCIEDKEEFIKIIDAFNGRKNVYTTIYSFGTIKEGKYYKIPDYDSAIVDKVFLDLDSKDSLVNIQKIHTALVKQDLKHTMIFSGGGFHCYIKCEKANISYKKECVMNMQRYVAELCKLTIGEPEKNDIDEHIIGDVARISRIPNTYNLKRKCFCIPIKEEDFEQYKTIPDFQEFAKLQRPMRFAWYGEKEIETLKYDFVPKDKQAIYDINIPDGKIDIKDFGEEKFWNCVKKMIVDRSNHKFWFWGAIWLRDIGYNKEETKEICKKYMSVYTRTDIERNDYEHALKHDSLFDIIFNKKTNNFFPTCEKLFSEGLCDGKCKHYNKLYLERR